MEAYTSYDVTSHVRVSDIAGRTTKLSDVLASYCATIRIADMFSPADDATPTSIVDSHSVSPSTSPSYTAQKTHHKFALSSLAGRFGGNVRTNASSRTGVDEDQLTSTSETQVASHITDTTDQGKDNGLKSYIARAIRKRDGPSPRELNVLAPTSL